VEEIAAVAGSFIEVILQVWPALGTGAQASSRT
jgi:hypothetical protein